MSARGMSSASRPDAYMLGWEAAIEDSREQLARNDAWQAGDGELCMSCERAYWHGLSQVQVSEEEQFRQGYMARWAMEVENFRDRLFPVSSK